MNRNWTGLFGGGGNRSPEALREVKDHPARHRRLRIVDSLLAGWIRRSEEIAEAVAGSGALEALLSDSESLFFKLTISVSENGIMLLLNG